MADFRGETRTILEGLVASPETALRDLAEKHLAADCVFDVAFPINRVEGREAVLERVVLPLRRALRHTRRRDEIFIGARNRRAEHGQWVASITHYLGNFEEALCGIRPSGRLAFLRSGEFYRVEEGKIVEAKIIFDFIDLMRQAGCFPLPDELGTEMLFPGPATHDGVLPANRESGEGSLDVVEGMLGDLHAFDPATFSSDRQTGDEGYWHEDMLWFGPGGIGSNYRWDGFVKDHREPFLKAFPDREGGNHYCRIGDGDYAAVSGWPSMTMTHRGDYLGVPATNKALSLRVMDFYRCAQGKVMENWVLLDYLDLFDQMGVDLLARAN
ncbi:ester cyclase [Pararhizobium mangrovi]|uniref:Ester cyclase n=1 Tax=Pararhizobium mangrovi TaxID=2590452 RepID=A0A506U3M4_9HYPH|nr:ester cyclase [Pararhizobium mangrovi]TPW27149.1 ester cyclase [Pararhizobium mangrovi]